MANVVEVMFPILEAVGVKSIAEVGSYAGDLTELLLDWAAPKGVRVLAIDPLPQPALVALSAQREELKLVRETSIDAIVKMEFPDAFIIDGDHNYHTVSEELRLISERVDGPEMPLLLFHDVCWPHARRDSYYAPERIPEEYQSSIGEGVGVFPGESGVTYGGLPYKWAQIEEGGPRNGVLTAIEDFVDAQDSLRLAVLPMFFGFGVCWHEQAPWANQVAELVEPWDRNPIVGRLEWNRVLHLAGSHRVQTDLAVAKRDLHTVRDDLVQLEERIAGQEKLLREVLNSNGLKLADRLTSLRPGDGPSLRERIDAALK